MTGLTLGHHFARGGVQCREQGGFMYKPTISRTLSTKKGSVESLKWFCRWGCKPNVRQMRWTASFDRPVSAPIERTDHCVSSSGLVFRVLYTTSATCSSLIDRGAPGRRSSCKPLADRSSCHAHHRRERFVGPALCRQQDDLRSSHQPMRQTP